LNTKIYLDYAATTPAAPEVADTMLHYLTLNGVFANPSSTQHCFGVSAEAVIDNARIQVAEFLTCKHKDLIFTSGATESNNLAIKGIAYSRLNPGNHIITSATEHKSVLETCRFLENEGFHVTYLRPNEDGLISIEAISDAITDKTILVSLIHVNNETGIIQDIEGISSLLNERKIRFHVDATQSIGKLPIDLSNLAIDLLSLSAHKIHGPKGIGCLYIRNRHKTKLTPLMHGGSQENRLRPGTLPTHQIAAMATALAIAKQNMAKDYQHAKQLRSRLLNILSSLDGVRLNGNQNYALPHIINVSFENVSADSLIIALRNDIAIASGSACNTGAIEASHVLRAMGIEGDRLYGAVRISFGRYILPRKK
jgi:cysteine desulfurase